jgi:hypothetical protein
MSEIRARYPEGYWEKKEMDLKRLAYAELKAESQPQEKQKPQKKGFKFPWQK